MYTIYLKNNYIDYTLSTNGITMHVVLTKVSFEIIHNSVAFALKNLNHDLLV